MAPRRLFVPGLSHHVYHRGNNRSCVFQDDGDRTVFLMLLGRAARRAAIRVHAYTLMDNHYHAVVSAPDEDALPRTMQRLGRGYVRYFNERHHRSGTLWEGRYRASLIQDECYWLTCMHYVEMNPVEARMVTAPEAYAWSSYRHHAFGDANPLLESHALFDALGNTETARQKAWRTRCGQELPVAEGELIRAALRSNGVLHSPGFEDDPNAETE